ncbi:MAG: ParB/RepB/Spo0J family partition protein [Candidatus Nanopelagicaceae bacterium]|jgi:ParB family chromosome partitioning protein
MMNRKGGLGRNLDALIPQSSSPISSSSNSVNSSTNSLRQEERSGSITVRLSDITPNPRQPREHFDAIALQELADSIREVGLLQPPIVRKKASGGYELIMGERRFRASKIAGLVEIPVIVRETSDAELLREALIENIHRSELNALEEAAAYNELLQDLGVTHDELAAKVGKSRAAITNTIRLLHLPLPVQKRLISGQISQGHARALLGLKSESEMERVADRIVRENLSVRAVEEIVALTQGRETKEKKRLTSNASVVEYQELAERLEERLETRVRIDRTKITIDFGDGHDLQRIVKIIRGGN